MKILLLNVLIHAPTALKIVSSCSVEPVLIPIKEFFILILNSGNHFDFNPLIAFVQIRLYRGEIVLFGSFDEVFVLVQLIDDLLDVTLLIRLYL